MLENIIKMHNIWWSEYWRGGKRDQYSFTYSAFKVNESIFSLGEHDPRVVKSSLITKVTQRKDLSCKPLLKL